MSKKDFGARIYKVKLTGAMPLLMHQDNLSWAEVMKKWSLEPSNKATSVAGDDRSPAWRWVGNLYTGGGKVVMPSDNLMTVLREGGKKCPTGKRGATFKTQTQSGLVVNESDWPLVVDGKTIPTEPIMGLVNNPNFEAHEEMASKLGFMLFVKRARIGQAKHVRVRPRFDQWSCAGTITVLDDQISKEVLQLILTQAGTYAGLGDWRPSSPKSPGPWGRFDAEVSEA